MPLTPNEKMIKIHKIKYKNTKKPNCISYLLNPYLKAKN